MFEGKSLLDILQFGGYTMCLLLICSIVSWAVIIERAVIFGVRARVKREPFMALIVAALKAPNQAEAARFCAGVNAPLARVVERGLEHAGASRELRASAMERQIAIEERLLEKRTNILGTIGGTVVYVGLFGTVIGVIQAFQDIAARAGAEAGIAPVIAGIAEALICTAAGIAVAVPAVVAFNLFVKRVESFVSDMELCASEINDELTKN